VRPVTVLIFHAPAPAGTGPLVGALVEARRALAERQRNAFLAAGANEVRIVEGPADGRSFGERLAAEVRAGAKGTHAGATGARGGTAAARAAGGLVVLGSGSIPLAAPADLRRFVEAAAGPGGHALANNRYSADVVAISSAEDLAELPPLPADNALPRWLEERAGVAVTDLRARWRLGVDIDTPLDLIMLGSGPSLGLAPLVGERLAALADVLRNHRAELLVAGRISAATLHWLESGVECRIRALVEERGLRAASRLAQSNGAPGSAHGTAGGTARGSVGGATVTTISRPPTSILGQLLDRDGPDALAQILATLGDAAVIDTRVLLAHRHGADESAWPPAEDRFASDLLLAASVADPWLRALTDSACRSAIPVLLGGHTALNGGLRLLAQAAGRSR
jgi:CTP:molybdopterin cytidylyltransferase MocA